MVTQNASPSTCHYNAIGPVWIHTIIALTQVSMINVYIVWQRGSFCCSYSCKSVNLLRKPQYNMMSWRLLLLLTSNLDMHACLKSRYACVSRFEVSNKMAAIKARRIVYWIKKYEHIRRFPLTELIVYQTTFSLFIITLPQCVFVVMTWTW